MQTEVQPLRQTVAESNALPPLSDFERLLASSHVATPQIGANASAQSSGPTKRWVAVCEIKGEIEVERELDYTINVCAICRKSGCSCQPRSIIAVKQRISYPVETVVATVITLQ